MWIGDVDVPQAVLDAAEAGTLVVFVGAGASRAQPSSLPDFAELVRDIGARAGRIPSHDDVKHPDVFLGRLKDSGVDVHRLVATAIDRPGSQPNRLHRAVVALAAACSTPMLVTTNYDLHLTTAAKALGRGIQVYEAPALPVGDDFDGVVHLHGSLNQPARRLVVTDGDFGRAYLREAWAARFLERMFSAFTVLFIGYSHGDIVMQYLARSLGPNDNRFVLTDDPLNVEWRRLGLTAIAYPNESGDHSALPATLERWVGLATMGQVDHRSRIAALVAAEPPTIPEEVSYIDQALAHPERIRYFVEKAHFDDERSHRWFGWIAARPAFARLFDDREASEPTSRVLAGWIADQYILSEADAGIALRAFSEKHWPPDLWSIIAQALFAHRGEFPKWLSPWLQLVLQNAAGREHDALDMMLVDKDWSTNFDLALTLFEDRTRPHIRRALDWGAPRTSPRFEVTLCGDEYWLTENWTNIFLPVLDQHLEQLIGLVSEQLARVYRNLRSLDPGATFDPIAFSRSAIERHEQDAHRESIDLLIDAARDCIETALSRDPTLGQLYLDTWSKSPFAILRRLAIHGWRVRTDVDSDEKLAWLREQDLLWDVSLHHEVFQLIRDTFPTASEGTARSLIDDAAAGPPREDEDEHRSWRSFGLLSWLADSAPNLPIAVAAFEEAQASHPDYERNEHPDLTHYGSVGAVEDAPPFTTSELHELIVQDVTAAIARLREFHTERHAVTGPSWTGALRALQSCVTTYPADGARVAEILQPEDVDLRASLIYGWDRATLEPALIESVLTIIAGWDHDEVRRTTCTMLSNGGDPEHPTLWHEIERAQQLASDLWPTSDVIGGIVSGSDLVMESINHPAGELAEFWTKVVQSEWTSSESSWGGIPQRLVTELNRLVSAPDRNGLLARTFLASQLHFFFGADREWCQASLLPRFDWRASLEEAAAAWQGFLTWGRWNDALLQSGLLNGYVETTRHVSELPQNLQRQLAAHLASVAMQAPTDPATWLTRFIVEAPEDVRVAWADQVGSALEDLDPIGVSRQWERWIQAYWSGRNQSVPLPFTAAEASATARWVLELGSVRPQAIDQVLGSRAALDPHGRLLYRIKDLDVAAEATDWARFLTHLLKNSTGQHWGLGYRLQEIVPLLRQGNPPPDLTELISEAMRLGATDAPDW